MQLHFLEHRHPCLCGIRTSYQKALIQPRNVSELAAQTAGAHLRFVFAIGQQMYALTRHDASVCIDAVKWLALLLLVILFAAANSCTTLVNRRDLYSPEPAPDSLEATRQMTTVTRTTTTMRSEEVVPAGY
jgi:hypothetical protein